jgi:hypothetical protein
MSAFLSIIMMRTICFIPDSCLAYSSTLIYSSVGWRSTDYMAYTPEDRTLQQLFWLSCVIQILLLAENIL